MKYIIIKASDYCGEEVKPCEEAFSSKVEQWDTRTFNEEEFNSRLSNREGLWRSKGSQHTITNEGYITRRMNDSVRWCIEIKTLENLMAFIEKHGQIIISYDDSCHMPQIEIDDWHN